MKIILIFNLKIINPKKQIYQQEDQEPSDQEPILWIFHKILWEDLFIWLKPFMGRIMSGIS